MESVTKLISLLNKPGLIHWSNKIGLNGVDLKDYQKKIKSEGINKHNEVEEYLKKGTYFDGASMLEDSLKGFDILAVEKDINNGFICGRADLILKKNKEVYVADFKSADKIYLSTKIQLSTYKHIYGADKICYISFNDYSVKEINIKTKYYYDIIRHLYKINQIIKDLNEQL